MNFAGTHRQSKTEDLCEESGAEVGGGVKGDTYPVDPGRKRSDLVKLQDTGPVCAPEK
jgi:hypothetical protein